MAEDPDDLFNQLKNVDRTVCGICKKKLVGPSYLGNVNGQMMSLCSACKHTVARRRNDVGDLASSRQETWTRTPSSSKGAVRTGSPRLIYPSPRSLFLRRAGE